jgi:hypothetical protein
MLPILVPFLDILLVAFLDLFLPWFDFCHVQFHKGRRAILRCDNAATASIEVKRENGDRSKGILKGIRA